MLSHEPPHVIHLIRFHRHWSMGIKRNISYVSIAMVTDVYQVIKLYEAIQEVAVTIIVF